MKNFTKLGFIGLLLLGLGCNESDNSNETNSLACLPANLQTDVVAMYTFGNGSINDSSGNNYDLTNTTTATGGMDRDGNPNCAFSFVRANGDILKYTNPTFLNNLPETGMTISFWYKSNDQNYGYFIRRDNVSHCDFSPGIWSFWHVNAVLGFGSSNGHAASGPVQTANWQHIVATSIDGAVTFYVDGVAQTPSMANPCTDTNIGDLFIGDQYDGLIDDIIIYDRVLTPAEVNQLKTLPACCN
ncbi:LamG domain-containing protein [Flavobacterium sp.]|uniref:LamG domain-containing protein n=1 Tax=Flavobacterium sp. TaxID=239 RepID=UPI00391C224B